MCCGMMVATQADSANVTARRFREPRHNLAATLKRGEGWIAEGRC
jgi:hypothetical protein